MKYLNDANYKEFGSRTNGGWKIVGNIHELNDLVDIAKEMIEGESD